MPSHTTNPHYLFFQHTFRLWLAPKLILSPTFLYEHNATGRFISGATIAGYEFRCDVSKNLFSEPLHSTSYDAIHFVALKTIPKFNSTVSHFGLFVVFYDFLFIFR